MDILLSVPVNKRSIFFLCVMITKIEIEIEKYIKDGLFDFSTKMVNIGKKKAAVIAPSETKLVTRKISRKIIKAIITLLI